MGVGLMWCVVLMILISANVVWLGILVYVSYLNYLMI